MKFMFSAFPEGLPGAALFVLRASVTVSLAVAGSRQEVVWIASALFLLAGAVAAGLWTRLAAALSFVGLLAIPLTQGTGLAELLVTPALDALAVALVGAGAWSIDARLFGRRTVHLAE